MDFDRWLNKSAADARAEINDINDKEYDLPEGVWRDQGAFWTNCCVCDSIVKLCCDLIEFVPGSYHGNCGPRCIP